MRCHHICHYIILGNLSVCHIRIEEFAKEKVDLTLATRPEFDTPLADLTDVKTMMDSINVIPGVV